MLILNLLLSLSINWGLATTLDGTYSGDIKVAGPISKECPLEINIHQTFPDELRIHLEKNCFYTYGETFWFEVKGNDLLNEGALTGKISNDEISFIYLFPRSHFKDGWRYTLTKSLDGVVLNAVYPVESGDVTVSGKLKKLN